MSKCRKTFKCLNDEFNIFYSIDEIVMFWLFRIPRRFLSGDIEGKLMENVEKPPELTIVRNKHEGKIESMKGPTRALNNIESLSGVAYDR